MKRALSTAIALVTALLMICHVGCRKNRVTRIKQMGQFAAKVTDITVDNWKDEKGIVIVIIGLEKDDGSELSIMEIHATPEQVAFCSSAHGRSQVHFSSGDC